MGSDGHPDGIHPSIHPSIHPTFENCPIRHPDEWPQVGWISNSESDLYTGLTRSCQELSNLAEEVKPITDSTLIKRHAIEMAHKYEGLTESLSSSLFLTNSKDVENALKLKTRLCGSSIINLINGTSSSSNILHQCKAIVEATQSILKILAASSSSAIAAHKLRNRFKII